MTDTEITLTALTVLTQAGASYFYCAWRRAVREVARQNALLSKQSETMAGLRAQVADIYRPRRAPGICLESGEFIPAAEIGRA